MSGANQHKNLDSWWDGSDGILQLTSELFFVDTCRAESGRVYTDYFHLHEGFRFACEAQTGGKNAWADGFPLAANGLPSGFPLKPKEQGHTSPAGTGASVRLGRETGSEDVVLVQCALFCVKTMSPQHQPPQTYFSSTLVTVVPTCCQPGVGPILPNASSRFFVPRCRQETARSESRTPDVGGRRHTCDPYTAMHCCHLGGAGHILVGRPHPPFHHQGAPTPPPRRTEMNLGYRHHKIPTLVAPSPLICYCRIRSCKFSGLGTG